MKKDAATADRWQQVAEIYLAAVERDPADREAFLREACAGDEGLRREVESLLCHEDGADALLERPAVALAAPMLDNSASSSLLVGRQIGPYTIVSWLGAGGMGEVYRARDTSLKRDVALKTLPQSLAMDSERLARFRREAEILASLNHPNIAAIYGLQDADAIKALVMELVEGEDLAARIARGPIPLEEALPIAKQIGEALDAAHESGIIHRDLKPANIKVRSDGTVKVLDFGLAKTVHAAAISGKLSDSPSLTSPSAMRQGVILGTAAYMAPEQARGQRVDKRADIWAFGVVLVEMLTGRPPFQGDDVTETMAAIVKTQPDLSGVPRVAQRLVGQCLEKDPALRLRDIGDAWELLADPDTNVPHSGSVRHVSLLRNAGVLLTSVALGLLIWLVRGNRELAPPQVTRFVDSLPEGRSMPASGISKVLALSPDGRALVYRAQDKGRFRLYRRFLDQPYAEPIGDDGAEEPFFSHDGQWVGYRVGRTLKRVPVRGGPAHTIVELPAEDFRGAHWTADGTIIVGGLSRGLWRVSERGGDIVTLGLPTDGRMISDPQVLPGGRAILYTEVGANKPDDILQIYDLQNNTSKRLLPGAAGQYLPSGHLVYTSAGTLWAVTFELDRMEVRGTPTPVLEGIREHVGGGPGTPYGVSGIVHAIVAPTGVLAYIPELDRQLRRTLVWVDREGREEPLGIEPGRLHSPRVSRDGTRIAFGRVDENDQDDVWIWDVVRRTSRQLTFDSTWNYRHAWFPDGKRLAFSAIVNGINQVFIQSADGSGVPEQITEGPTHVVPTTFSPDGQLICAELYWTNNNERRPRVADTKRSEIASDAVANTDNRSRCLNLAPMAGGSRTIPTVWEHSKSTCVRFRTWMTVNTR